jgi:hypothetical protein
VSVIAIRSARGSKPEQIRSDVVGSKGIPGKNLRLRSWAASQAHGSCVAIALRAPCWHPSLHDVPQYRLSLS